MRTLPELCRVFESKNSDQFAAACDDVIEIAKVGLSIEDTAALAVALAKSGQPIVLPTECAPFGDVPSTGGPGSLTTLLCPVLLCVSGVTVPKVSASGSVAGAIDALELIPGYQAHLSQDEFIAALRRCRIAHTIQTADFCPADRYLIERRRVSRTMRNPWLATASLLSKKVAVPGTSGIFDFRLGNTGNIADNVADAMLATEHFRAVARLLNLRVGICVTDNRTPPCSAIGRFESLSLLCKLLKGQDPGLELDAAHRDMCVHIAAIAAAVASGDTNVNRWRVQLQHALEKGAAWEVFCKHLQSQGSNEKELESAMTTWGKLGNILVTANADGIWHSTNLLQLKDWLKDKQANAEGTEPSTRQIGIRFLVSPGSEVKNGDALIRVTGPSNFRLTDYDISLLRGQFSNVAMAPNERLIKVMM